MSQKKYVVRVLLTDKCSDSIEQILHGDGSSLGPTFDKIAQEALMHNGHFEDWEPTCCDYSFSDEKDVLRFINIVKTRFSDQVDLECKFDMDNPITRVYPSLPNTLSDRIAALTPKKIYSLDVKIATIDDAECSLASEQGYYRTTYSNMICKITGKIRSEKVLLKSGPMLMNEIFSKILTKENLVSILKSAEKAGWTKNDISYDALISGLLFSEINDETISGNYCPEIFYAATTIVIIVSDYNQDQFVGWLFYNENLDDLLKFTACKVG